jgi:outer membrane protein assembly factor BamE (lipoprotein component of BamABCDE complex)
MVLALLLVLKNDRPPFRFSLRTLLLAVTVCGPVFWFFAWGPYHLMEGHPVSLVSLARVQHGMTETEVKNILGKPSRNEQVAGRTLWTYSGSTWYIVRIRFGDDGTVVEVDHDH